MKPTGSLLLSFFLALPGAAAAYTWDNDTSTMAPYVGLGTGVFATFDDITFENTGAQRDLGLPPTPVLDILLGIEEKGWALEFRYANGFETIDHQGQDVHYDLSRASLALVYRAMTSGTSYTKWSLGMASSRIDAREYTPQANDYGISSSGLFAGIGVGFHIDRTQRVEFDLTASGSSETGPALMLSADLLFGGDSPDTLPPHHGAIYFGIQGGGWMFNQGDSMDPLYTGGILLGYDFGTPGSGFALEGELNLSSTASYDDNGPDEYSMRNAGLYFAFRTAARFYLKAKLGFQTIEYDIDAFDEVSPGVFVPAGVVESADSGAAAGVGFGYRLDSGSRIELDLTTVYKEVPELGYSAVTLGYQF